MERPVARSSPGLDTLTAWKNDYPEFSVALNEGKTEADSYISESMYHRARGTATIPAVKIFMPAGSVDEDGNPKPVIMPHIEHAFADVNAGFRWLYNRQPERWRDRRYQVNEGGIDVRLAAMTPDERAADAIALVARVKARLAALQQIEGRPTVFVRSRDGFEARGVKIGRETELAAEILGGLKAGEQIAVSNTFVLKSDLGKSKAAD